MDLYKEALSAAHKVLYQHAMVASVAAAPSPPPAALVERIQVEAGFAKAASLFAGFIKCVHQKPYQVCISLCLFHLIPSFFFFATRRSVTASNTPDLLAWGSDRTASFAPSILASLLGRAHTQAHLPEAEAEAEAEAATASAGDAP